MSLRWVPYSSLLGYVLAQNSSDDGYVGLLSLRAPPEYHPSFASDPVLALRPPLARSLPVQLLLNGIVLTLMSVLLLQLLFTAQYHFRLAPVNFSLQVSAVCTLLVSSISTIQVVMSTVSDQSQTWPYMLNYVSVDIPPECSEGWSTAGRAAWLLMTATTGMLIQCTHIQFLTLLFPSKLERRLIFTLLGPLALTSAAMQLMRIKIDMPLGRIALAVQNVCNATLSLLFTASLLLWGLFVNRKNAWRTDGGTAAFGVGALTLAPMSTAISLVYIPSRDQFSWMKPLMWSVILWQSFLGWWWWVGAGMGVGELDELLIREEKRQNKRKRRSARRKVQRERAETLFKGVVDVFGFGERQGREDVSSANTHAPPPSATAIRRLFNHSYNIFLSLRHEHLTAAREQAAEWVERVNQVYGPEEPGVRGWGLGQYGMRRVQERDVGDNETVVNPGSDSDVDVGGDVDMEEAETGKGVEAGVEGAKASRDEDVDADDVEIDIEVEDGTRRVRRRHRRRTDRPSRTSESHSASTSASAPGGSASASTSMWWWGPLRRWRLQDVTEY